MPEVITSRQNARVRELRAALRGNAPDGLVAVEGSILVSEALTAQQAGLGPHVDTIFLREDAQEMAAFAYGMPPPVILSRDAFDSAASTEQSQGIAALVRKPQHPFAPRVGDVVVVAAGLQDPGNLGTLIRSAAAYSAAAVLLAQQTVDPWNGKAQRASAGAVFRMPLPAWSDQMLGQLRSRNIRLLAAVPGYRDAQPAHEVDLTQGCAFLIGNEGNGLSKAMLDLADAHITLPMPGAAESLNAAVAGSLLLYEAARQRGFRS